MCSTRRLFKRVLVRVACDEDLADDWKYRLATWICELDGKWNCSLFRRSCRSRDAHLSAVGILSRWNEEAQKLSGESVLISRSFSYHSRCFLFLSPALFFFLFLPLLLPRRFLGFSCRIFFFLFIYRTSGRQAGKDWESSREAFETADTITGRDFSRRPCCSNKRAEIETGGYLRFRLRFRSSRPASSSTSASASASTSSWPSDGVVGSASSPSDFRLVKQT